MYVLNQTTKQYNLYMKFLNMKLSTSKIDLIILPNLYRVQLRICHVLKI